MREHTIDLLHWTGSFEGTSEGFLQIAQLLGLGSG